MIQPILDKANWSEVYGNEVLPLLVWRPLGRPKMNRRRNLDEIPLEKRRYNMCY